jgi:hypothetical protein
MKLAREPWPLTIARVILELRCKKSRHSGLAILSLVSKLSRLGEMRLQEDRIGRGQFHRNDDY